MSNESVYKAARDEFNHHAGAKPDEVIGDCYDLSRLQAKVSAWQASNFGGLEPVEAALGISEELGEGAEAFLSLAAAQGRACHALLKARQRIRGYDDPEKVRAEVADACADLLIFTMGLCTTHRLDFGKLLVGTANEVMERDFKKFPKNGRTV